MLLAVDTATPQVSVALRRAGGAVASWRRAPGRDHGEALAPLLASSLAAEGITPADLTAVAVDVGPGLFTGLRVGLATAKALSAALGIPVVGVTSLEILAWPHRHDHRIVAAVVDARRKEVFRALYRPAPSDRGPAPTEPAARESVWNERAGRELAAPTTVSPEDLAAELAALGEPVLAVGDGARRYADVLAGERVEIAGPDGAYPDAASLAELAAARVAAGEVTDAAGLRPCYLRQPDVRIGWDQRPAAEASARG